MGGLGNQLFQIFTTISYSKRIVFYLLVTSIKKTGHAFRIGFVIGHYLYQ